MWPMSEAARPDLLTTWGITAEELSEIVAENPSMRGLMFGFVAEYKLKKMWLLRRRIKNLVRPRSHDRKQKCDFRFDYRGVDVTVEVKCLDSPKAKCKEGVWNGTSNVMRAIPRMSPCQTGKQWLRIAWRWEGLTYWPSACLRLGTDGDLPSRSIETFPAQLGRNTRRLSKNTYSRAR